MRWKIIVVNASIVALVALLSYVLLATSLLRALSATGERQRSPEHALHAAYAQLALDALRVERWLDDRARDESVRVLFSAAPGGLDGEAAAAAAKRLRDAAVVAPELAGVAPSVVALVDVGGVMVAKNGLLQLRSARLTDAHPSLAAALTTGRTGSAVWIGAGPGRVSFASFAPVRDEHGRVVGALVLGTALGDERLLRTSELTSGSALFYETLSGASAEVVARGGGGSQALLSGALAPDVTSAARAALTSRTVVRVSAEIDGHFFGALRLAADDEAHGVLLAAVPTALVPRLGALLWPVLAVGVLGLLLVGIGGVLLGDYLVRPLSVIEDGLLTIINGNARLRFRLEHDVLRRLVVRLNALLDVLADGRDRAAQERQTPTPSGRRRTKPPAPAS